MGGQVERDVNDVSFEARIRSLSVEDRDIEGLNKRQPWQY